jgi:pimeloyl-ACP methyl ester carboxylesterase
MVNGVKTQVLRADYLMHYLDLFDELKLKRFHLVGQSLGGWMAAAFATQQTGRLQRLVLVCPAGLWVREHPITDLFRMKPEELPAALAENLAALGPPPDPHNVDAIVEGYREMTTLARIGWQRMYDPKLARYLHRIDVPTLLACGEQDRVVPIAQSGSGSAWCADHNCVPSIRPATSCSTSAPRRSRRYRSFWPGRPCR